MLYFILTVSLRGIVIWLEWVFGDLRSSHRYSPECRTVSISHRKSKIFSLVFFLRFSCNKWHNVSVLYQRNIFSKEIFPTTLQTSLLQPFSIASSHCQGKISRILYGGTHFLTMKFLLLSKCWLVNSRTIEKIHHILLLLLFWGLVTVNWPCQIYHIAKMGHIFNDHFCCLLVRGLSFLLSP